MSVSIIVATKDRERVLPRALSSARRESPAAEILVVAAEPTEGVLRTAARFGADVVTESGTGLAAAWNLGVARTSGDVVVFLNDDDVLLPGALRDLAVTDEAGVVGRAVTVAAGRCRSVADDGRLPLELVLFGPLNFNARFWRRSALEDLGPFDPSFRLAVDREMALRARHRGHRFRPVDRPVYAYLLDAGSRTFAPDRRALITMHAEQVRLLGSLTHEESAITRSATAIADLWLAVEEARADRGGHRAAALRAIPRRWRDTGPLLRWFLRHHRRRRAGPSVTVDCGPIRRLVDPQGWTGTP